MRLGIDGIAHRREFTQHLAGIGSATRIIAINSDREAPIFRYAEAGAVGDAATLLPHIARALGARDGEAT